MTHQDRVEHKLSMNRRPGRPTDGLVREELHNDDKVESALPRTNGVISVTQALFRRVTVNWRLSRLGIRTEGFPTDQRRMRRWSSYGLPA